MEIIAKKNGEKGYNFNLPESKSTTLLEDIVPVGEQRKLYRNGETLILKEEGEEIPEGAIKLCTLINDKEKWKVLLEKGPYNSGMNVPRGKVREVKKGDEITLGIKAKIKIVATKVEGEFNEDVEAFKAAQFEATAIKCCVCHGIDHTEGNPLIVISQPNNKLVYVHYSCMDESCSKSLVNVLAKILELKISLPTPYVSYSDKGGSCQAEFVDLPSEDSKEECKKYRCQNGDVIEYGKKSNIKGDSSKYPTLPSLFKYIQYQSTLSQIDCFKCIYFCDSSPNNPLDPMISICKCKGSAKYVHFSCFKQFIESRFQQRDKDKPGYVEYPGDGKCERCKTDITPYLNILYAPSVERYVLVQTESYMPDDPRPIRFAVLDFSTSKFFVIGRASTVSNLTFEKVPSVSQYHGNIRYDEERKSFLLEDNSTFGTRICREEPFEFPAGSTEFFQFEEIVITIKPYSP